MLKGSLGVTAATALFGTAALTSAAGPAKAASAAFAFRELQAGVDETHHVAEGYEADILIRWGDPLAEGLGAFDPQNLTAEEQAKRFGYNNDYIAFFPLDRSGTRGLLCVNHEYASPEVMFPGVAAARTATTSPRSPQAHVEVEMAAHGVSVVEIALDGRQVAPAHRQHVQSPHHRLDRNDDRRPGRRPRPAEDQRRSDGRNACWARSTTAPAARRRGAPT